MEAAKLAGDQSKWLASLATAIIPLVGLLVRFDILAYKKIPTSCILCAPFTTLLAVTSLVMGSVVQASILQYLAGDSPERPELACSVCHRWHDLRDRTIGGHLWQQRVALYGAVLFLIIGFTIGSFEILHFPAVIAAQAADAK